MAKSSKRGKSNVKPSVDDAVEVNADADETRDASEVEQIDTTDTPMSDAETAEAKGGTVEKSEPDASTETLEVSEPTASVEEDAPQSDLVEPQAPQNGDASDFEDTPTEDTPAPTNPVESQSASKGFVPLLFGGVVAGAIGYGIAFYVNGSNGATADDLAMQLETQAGEIAALQSQLAELSTLDLAAVETQIETVATQTADQIDTLSNDLSSDLSALDARLVEVEKRPNSDGTLSDTALQAYQRELEELRADLDAQQETVMSAAAQAEADLASARQEAARLEQEAIAQAEAAAARAALNRIATAVETGSPFAEALTGLNVDEVPAALAQSAEEGVATTATLVADFPEAARAALATARSEGLSDDAGGVGGFLRSQFDVRSTAPREGSGPDAVLSRAEAAVKEGRIADALSELEALPDVARAELTDWTERATERANVLDAISTLSETYN